MRNMPSTSTPKYTAPRPARNPHPHTRANMRFGMPASWEEMEALGLDPLTGEVVD